MATILGRSVGVLLAAFAASNAIAQPVTLSVASGTAAITSQTNSGGAWTVVIHVTAGSPAVFTVTTATANVVVEQIEVECDADCLMTVNESGSGTFSEIRSIVEKATSSPESFDIDSIVFSGLLGPGVVAAEAIDEIQIGGDLTATVTAGPRASSADSDISLIDVGGDIIDADINCHYGSITQVLVGGVIDGVAGVDKVFIHARDGIREIEAESMDAVDIWANFTGISLPLATGTLSRLECRSGSFTGQSSVIAYEVVEDVAVADPGVFIDGDASGAIWVQTAFNCPIEIAGDLTGSIFASFGGFDIGSATQGDVTIHGDITSTAFIYAYEPDGLLRTTIRVGGAFDGEMIMVGLADGADVGQVIFNASNVDAEWTGDFQVGETTILAPTPHYADEDLEGAVGLVPFALHDGDCEPENTQTTASSSFIDLAFYGPVTWDPMEGLPFTIEWREWTGSTWTSWTDDSAFWDINNSPGTRWVELIYVDGSDPSVIPGGRQYRITPVLTGDNALLCDDLLTVSDVAVDDFTYVFETP